ncbi:MAG: dialkylrecorsinol condensing enzyme [Arcobacter sp.]|uniref:dialkylrecorsinol condensing enzyme n=1 Tax=uncultured Arcobacter sp. TaxID=165434 RepID=UPI000CA81B3E|nr:dialkylrecorsinol condensing enzyme [uncultured Arcobacter sp.]PLY09934.1 MAG: dialkylrecorsinol condensing enzyme [Arcobacter sp.]
MNQKKVLVVSYSQTGQLNNLVKNFTKPLYENEDIELFYKNIKPKKPYPFPWSLMTFMDSFPESVYLDTCEIEEFEDDSNDYDLIILSYQVWFLSPSIPISSFLKSSWAKSKFKNKPVITLIGCRNMWIMAQEKMKQMLSDLEANLIDNVVLIDKGNSLETFITTPRWMLTGKKNSIFGLSSAGISEDEIIKSQRFGKALVDALKSDKEKENKSLLYGLKAVVVNTKLIRSEQIGTKSFTIWGGLIRKIGKPGNIKRKPVVMLYLIFLLLMIVTVVPINMIIQSVLRKINKNAVIKQKELYELPSGSGEERIKEYQ